MHATPDFLADPARPREMRPRRWLVRLHEAGLPYAEILKWVDDRLVDSVANALGRARYEDEDERARLTRLGYQVTCWVPTREVPDWARLGRPNPLPAPLHTTLSDTQIARLSDVLFDSPDLHDRRIAYEYRAAEDRRARSARTGAHTGR